MEERRQVDRRKSLDSTADRRESIDGIYSTDRERGEERKVRTGIERQEID